jgi:hypothetical protein
LTEEIINRHLERPSESPVEIYFPNPGSLRQAIFRDERFDYDLTKSLFIDEAILSLYNTIELCFGNPFTMYLLKPSVFYSLKTCTDLFIASVTCTEKPLVVPLINLSSPEVYKSVMKKYLGKLPFELNQYGQTIKFFVKESKYILEVYGERGNFEKRLNFNDPEAAYGELFNLVVGLEGHMETYYRPFDINPYLVK